MVWLKEKVATPSSYVILYKVLLLFFIWASMWDANTMTRKNYLCSFVNENISSLIIKQLRVYVFPLSPPTITPLRFFTLIVFGIKYHHLWMSKRSNSSSRRRRVYFRSSGLLRTNGGFEGVCVCVFVYVFICEKMHKFTLPVGGGEIPFSLYKTQNLPVYSIKVLDPRTQSLWWICERKENSLMEWPSKRTLGRCERFCIGSCSQKVEILRGFQPKVHDARAACSQLLHNFNYLGSCTYYLLSTCALLNEKRIRVFSRWEIFWAMLILVKFRGRVSWNASVSKFASGYTLILFIIISSWVLRFVIRLEREFLLRMKKSSSSVFRFN